MSDKPPCDCIEEEPSGWTYTCHCSNAGDTAYAASWCTEKNIKANAADEIDRLRDRVKALEEALHFSMRISEMSATMIRDPARTQAYGKVAKMCGRIAAQFERLASRARAALETKP